MDDYQRHGQCHTCEPPALVFCDLSGAEQLKVELIAADIASHKLDMIVPSEYDDRGKSLRIYDVCAI